MDIMDTILRKLNDLGLTPETAHTSHRTIIVLCCNKLDDSKDSEITAKDRMLVFLEFLQRFRIGYVVILAFGSRDCWRWTGNVHHTFDRVTGELIQMLRGTGHLVLNPCHIWLGGTFEGIHFTHTGDFESVGVVARSLIIASNLQQLWGLASFARVESQVARKAGAVQAYGRNVSFEEDADEDEVDPAFFQAGMRVPAQPRRSPGDMPMGDLLPARPGG